MIAKQVAKYLRQNLEKFAHEGAHIPTLWMCPIGEVEKDLTLAPRRDTQKEKIGVKEVWVSKCKHTEKATRKIVEERQHMSSVRASDIIVVKSESGQYISDGSPRKEVSPVLREEVKMIRRGPNCERAAEEGREERFPQPFIPRFHPLQAVATCSPHLVRRPVPPYGLRPVCCPHIKSAVLHSFSECCECTTLAHHQVSLVPRSMNCMDILIV